MGKHVAVGGTMYRSITMSGVEFTLPARLSLSDGWEPVEGNG